MADSTWITPKTDWVSTDTFNVDDFNRIKNNLNYLADACGKDISGQAVVIIDMGDDKTLPSMFYASDMNKFENNLATISAQTYKVDYGEKTIYTADGNTPTYDEMNRIESALYDMYKIWYERQHIARYYFGEPYSGEINFNLLL